MARISKQKRALPALYQASFPYKTASIGQPIARPMARRARRLLL
jgi:hypothetical protein